MVADSNTNSKGNSSGADKNSSKSSSGGNTNSKGSSSSAGKNSGGSAGGGLNSAGNRASGAGPSSSGNRSTTGGGFGSSNASKGGGLNSAGNRASGAGPSASSNRSTTGGGFGGNSSSGVGGGLNSAGNRASGAGPMSSGNRSTTGSGFGGGTGGGLNSAGNRASGAGPGAAGNTSTTGNGYGSSTSGGMVSDAARRAEMAQAARASENASMDTYNAARSLSQANAQRADLAQQARAAETTSMRDLARERALGTIGKAEAGVKDPYSMLSGGQVTADLANMTVRDAIALSKTTWNGKLANVVGAYQFKDTTLASVAAKMGLLDAKMTPAVQDRIAVGLMQQRANQATVNGAIDVDKFAKELSKEWASIATTTGQSYYNANGIDKASISYSKARDIAKDLVANGVVSAGKTVGSITSKDVSSVQTQATGISRFSSTYMGSKTTAAPSKNAATSQQNDPSGLPAGTYRGYDPSGLPPDKPTTGPVPTARPTSAVSSPTASAPTPTVAPARQPSLAEKVAAAGIDVGLGMLPGVGMGVSVINGGLALTGNKTLGERIAGSIATGEGAGAGPDSGANRTGGGRGQDQAVKNTSTVPKQSESFEDRYMKFVDPTPRPTPAQRWDYNTPGYA